ncbi:hypothetical protein Pla52o_30050 [Novipirellula galeiformis]|uniref:Uncharacterized protein n=1 Tax=Novipirellula galeiformis TaxID=2528004 RepID=A0A5C6CKW5_9BACT|nr:hypothetical protein [Novipirellula galeiformis]TWU23469.1 hypothetical protein Pla52o_30050 [Novipirellula galeiformis]
MGLLDRAKAAAQRAADKSTSLASNTFDGLWTTHGDKVCEMIHSHASQVATQGGAIISNDESYRLKVIDPAWEMLPMPVRLLGRERLKWDALFISARGQIFVIDGESVLVHPDAKQRIDKLLSKVSRSDRTNPTPGVATIESDVRPS